MEQSVDKHVKLLRSRFHQLLINENLAILRSERETQNVGRFIFAAALAVQFVGLGAINKSQTQIIVRP